MKFLNSSLLVGIFLGAGFTLVGLSQRPAQRINFHSAAATDVQSTSVDKVGQPKFSIREPAGFVPKRPEKWPEITSNNGRVESDADGFSESMGWNSKEFARDQRRCGDLATNWRRNIDARYVNDGYGPVTEDENRAEKEESNFRYAKLSQQSEWWLGRGHLPGLNAEIAVEVALSIPKPMDDDPGSNTSQCVNFSAKLFNGEGQVIAAPAGGTCVPRKLKKDGQPYLTVETYFFEELSGLVSAIDLPLPGNSPLMIEFLPEGEEEWKQDAGFHWAPIREDEYSQFLEL